MSERAPVIFWFRRDLRLGDHPALRHAVELAGAAGAEVLPVFVLDPLLVARSGPNRLAHLYGCLRSLIGDGVPVRMLHGSPAEQLTAVVSASGSTTVVCTGDFGPYGTARDALVRRALAAAGAELLAVDSPYVIPPGTVLKGDGTPYKVFTPFSRQWSVEARGQRPSPRLDPREVPWAAPSSVLPMGGVPDDPSSCAPHLPVAGEAAATARIEHFVSTHLRAYDERRNDPAADATSRLSSDLKFGVVHPRQLLARVGDDAGSGGRVFVTELCWRDFYADVLHHRPDTARHDVIAEMERMRYDRGPAADERFEAWCHGRTGYPFIDAGMRQLLAEGWMHNRVRMAVASFLVKDLHLDWRRGAAWFMHHLVDGDLASNQHGWQWTAGTGTDAAPYFRVFNPVSQGRKFDPTGTYVRRYVPELRGVPDRYVHEPWTAPPAGGADGQLFDIGSPGSSYPPPVVDHASERIEALDRYAEVRAGRV